MESNASQTHDAETRGGQTLRTRTGLLALGLILTGVPLASGSFVDVRQWTAINTNFVDVDGNVAATNFFMPAAPHGHSVSSRTSSIWFTSHFTTTPASAGQIDEYSVVLNIRQAGVLKITCNGISFSRVAIPDLGRFQSTFVSLCQGNGTNALLPSTTYTYETVVTMVSGTNHAVQVGYSIRIEQTDSVTDATLEPVLGAVQYGNSQHNASDIERRAQFTYSNALQNSSLATLIQNILGRTAYTNSIINTTLSRILSAQSYTNSNVNSTHSHIDSHFVYTNSLVNSTRQLTVCEPTFDPVLYFPFGEIRRDPEIITNPGFETYTVSPGVPDDWLLLNGLGTYFSRETTIVHSGSNSVKATRTGGSDAGIEFEFSTVVGESYSLEVWARTGGSGHALLGARDSSDNVVKQRTGTTGTTTFEQLEMSFIATTTTSSIALNVVGADGDVVYFDDSTAKLFFVGDRSGNGNDGHPVGFFSASIGGPPPKPSGLDTGLFAEFSGVFTQAGPDAADGFLRVADDITLDDFEEISVSVWVRPESTSGIRYIANKGWDLNLDGDDVEWGPTDVGAIQSVASDVLVAGEWTHIVATYDGAVQALYINSVLEDSDPQTNVIPSTSGPLRVGTFDESIQFFEGNMDEFRVHDGALTHSQIVDLYQGCGDFDLTPVLLALDSHDTNQTSQHSYQNTQANTTHAHIDSHFNYTNSLINETTGLIEGHAYTNALINATSIFGWSLQNSTHVHIDGHFVYTNSLVNQTSGEVLLAIMGLNQTFIGNLSTGGFLGLSSLPGLEEAPSNAIIILLALLVLCLYMGWLLPALASTIGIIGVLVGQELNTNNLLGFVAVLMLLALGFWLEALVGQKAFWRLDRKTQPSNRDNQR